MSSRLAPDITAALRPVDRVADRALLLQVYADARAEELSVVPWTEEQLAAFLEQQFTAQDTYWRELRPAARFDVIEVDGRPVGRLYVDRMPDEIRVVDIALLAEHRGAGIGTALLRDILREGSASGRPVTIHVERGNRARTLYERLGFRQISTTGVYDLLEWREPKT